jgi:hypothetical protein
MKTYTLTSQAKGAMNETIYSYKSENKGLAFFMHPKKAFSFVLYQSLNMTKKEINSFLDTWVETAIGPSEQFNDRIKTIQIA